MNAQKSRKFVVAGVMAGLVAIGAVVFAMRSHPVAPVAAAVPAPAALAPVPAAAPAPVAPIPEATPAVAKVPDAPAVVAHKDRASTKSAATRIVASADSPAVEPKVARTRHQPKVDDTSAGTSSDAATRTAPAFDASAKLAAETVVAAAAPAAPAPTETVAAATAPAAPAPAAPAPTETVVAAAAPVAPAPAAPAPAAPAPTETVAAATVPAAPAPTETVAAATVPAASSTPVAGQAVAASPAVAAATDSKITTDVKSQMAVDSVTKNANIGVTTTDGVVALTGSLTTQDAIDHVKDVAGKVKDVKSVDTTALVLASL